MPSITTPASSYVGRFAPSPTGQLHLGSLLAAVASYVDARANLGKWLLRIEDLDPPREEAGASEHFITALRAHGLIWDAPVLFQSKRHQAYQEAIENLLNSQQAFYCQCSRKILSTNHGIHREPCNPENKTLENAAIRLRVPDTQWCYHDRIKGLYKEHAKRDVGDFVLKRRDNLFAYQLAVVVDDAYQGITHVVRGEDLLISTPRQQYLQQCLGFASPEYAHIPILTGENGQKLSKQNFAKPIALNTPEKNLLRTLSLLGQPKPPTALQLNCEAILQFAAAHWNISKISDNLPSLPS